MKLIALKFHALILSCVLVSACSFAPDYQTPTLTIPTVYKENGGWINAQSTSIADNSTWWKVFNDSELDSLEDQVTTANQNLKLAVAQYDAARASAAVAYAGYFPVLTADASTTRQQLSQKVANKPGVNRYNTLTAGVDLTYEIDLWGRVRNTVAANEDQAKASAADVAAVSLSLHATLALDYFTLRGLDAAEIILEKTVAAYQEAYDLTLRRYQGGIATEADADQAETQLDNAKTQAADLHLQRAQLEHAIAILIGQPPSNFSLEVGSLTNHIPSIQVDLPSVLLERRPDVVAAEMRIEAANASIGVARSAWFPDFNLAAMFGFESASSTQWLTAPSRFWSLGPSAVMPLFEGGQINALNDEARAAYEQAVAVYRQTALTAFGEVEDNLVALHQLAEESKTQHAANLAAQKSLDQASELYKAGATTYLDVVAAQNSDLQAQLATVTITVRQLTANVQLIKALGGGWKSQKS